MESRSASRLPWWLGFVAWALALTAVSSIPGDRMGALPFPGADKVVHFGMFFVGAILLGMALRPHNLAGGRSVAVRLVTALGLLLAVGGLDETHQLFVKGRSGGDPGDLAADVAGALAGLAGVMLFHARRPAIPHLGPSRADRAA